ncbi:MAG: tripartite tricarboxylate transporter TctB family protein [Beijerinckiaceae bacterium]|jgi:hypothetical protein|nr:tripartite tricarboxylate transporter TctB family protein [Beijerinckiaceae bacterium]
MPLGDETIVLSRRQAEIGFAILAGLAGFVILFGAMEHDTGWSRSGPEAGYFPFRLGMLLMAASGVILLRVLLQRGPSEPFLSWGAAKKLLAFLLPLIGFVLLIGPVGLYLAGAAYLFVAIGLIGRVPWLKSGLIAVLVPVFLFIAFEYAFKAPLPKGPLGPLFGLI